LRYPSSARSNQTAGSHLQAVDAPWQLPPPGPGFILFHALRATLAGEGFRISMPFLPPRQQRGSRRRGRRY